jgi:hypothetical protein
MRNLKISVEYLLHTARSDIEYLGDNWGKRVDNDTLRRGSTILRRLLLNGDLQKAWLAIGMIKEPHIIAPNLDLVIQSGQGSRIVSALAGGGEYDGTYVRLAVLNKGSTSIAIPDEAREFKFGLHGFVESTGIYLQGRKIKRKHIIKYVAEKLGGAHLDFKRTTQNNGDVYLLLDANVDHYQVLDKNGIYFELLSIGQRMACAPDIQEFIKLTKDRGL